MSETFTEIPIVDLASATGDDARFADEICTICHEVGFFVVTNHGVAPSVTGDLFELMAQFFALPVDQKLLIDKRNSPHFRAGSPKVPNTPTTALTSASRSTSGPTTTHSIRRSSRRTSGCSARTNGCPTRCCPALPTSPNAGLSRQVASLTGYSS